MAELFKEPAFWVEMSFLCFLVLAFWKGKDSIKAFFDQKIQLIKDEIKQAHDLREQASKNLADVQKKDESLEGIVKQMVEEAERQAKSLIEEGKKEVERQRELKNAHMHHRITHMEHEAVESFRKKAAALAIEVSILAIEDHLSGKAGEVFIDRAIDRVANKISA